MTVLKKEANLESQSDAKKHTSVKVIGWIFIVIAGLMIFSGAMGYIAYTSMQKMSGGVPPASAGMPNSFQLMAIVFQHIELLTTVQVTFGVFIIFAGIYFLKLRPWARAALEVVSWLGLVYVLGFGIFALVSWISMSAKMPASPGAQGAPLMFNIMGMVTGLIVMAVWAVPIVVIIKFLRGSTIRDVFKQK